METPIRVQRKRTKGFKLPENTVCVTRGTKWGNPYKIGETIHFEGMDMLISDNEWSVTFFQWHLTQNLKTQIKAELKGKNLACFCPLDKPCHADILLKIANEL